MSEDSSETVRELLSGPRLESNGLEPQESNSRVRSSEDSSTKEWVALLDKTVKTDGLDAAGVVPSEEPRLPEDSKTRLEDHALSTERVRQARLSAGTTRPPSSRDSERVPEDANS